MAQVVLENIDKRFPRQGHPGKGAGGMAIAPPEVAALRNVNLTVQDGELMVLVGPSGCGKSTLLRIIAGLERATAGRIWVGDRPVTQLPPKERNMAMVFQNYALYPHLTVYDNLAFGLRRTHHYDRPAPRSWGEGLGAMAADGLASFSRALPRSLRYWTPTERMIGERIDQVAEVLQLQGLLHRFPRELSGGQKQRVALGRAIARNPAVFLMDEPLSNLDAKLRTDTRVQIVALQRQLGTTTIYVTHDQVEAMTMGDRITVLKEGQIQQVATPLEIYHSPANCFVAAFMGSPPMNFLTVQVEPPFRLVHPLFSFSLGNGWLPVVKPYWGQTLILGIRPEHLKLSVPAPKNLQGQVQHLEALGHETHATIALPLERIPPSPLPPQVKVRLGPEQRLRLGETVWLALEGDGLRFGGGPTLHLFDPETEVALPGPGG